MQPLTLLILIMFALVAYFVASGYVGHWIGKALYRSRRHGGKSRVVRFATSYIPWSIGAGLLMCTIILGSATGPIVPVVAFGPFLVALLVADSLEPEMKKCKTCGQCTQPYQLGDAAWRHINERVKK